MARTRVSCRLARDFWVRPSEAMIRRWCRDDARGRDFARNYQAWMIEKFSGVLCIDEVYVRFVLPKRPGWSGMGG